MLEWGYELKQYQPPHSLIGLFLKAKPKASINTKLIYKCYLSVCITHKGVWHISTSFAHGDILINHTNHNHIIVLTWTMSWLVILSLLHYKIAEKQTHSCIFLQFLCSHVLMQQCSCASVMYRLLIAAEPLARTESVLVNWSCLPSDLDTMGRSVNRQSLRL